MPMTIHLKLCGDCAEKVRSSVAENLMWWEQVRAFRCGAYGKCEICGKWGEMYVILLRSAR